MVMISGPILLGLMAQRVKARTGARWWFLSLVLMGIANLLAGGGRARTSSHVLWCPGPFHPRDASATSNGELALLVSFPASL